MGKTFVVIAGGTAGHVYPAFSVVEKLLTMGCKVIWLGEQNSFEESLCKKYGIEFISIEVNKFARQTVWQKIYALYSLIKNSLKLVLLLKSIKPYKILATGGYVSAPIGISAFLLRIPLIIHEQNIIPGLANRFLAKFASKILVAYPNTFSNYKNNYFVGNPIRNQLLCKNIKKTNRSAYRDKFKILVLGGSQGASVLNREIPILLKEVSRLFSVQIVHQTGKQDLLYTSHIYQQYGIDAHVSAFIDDLSNVYRDTDLVISRCGAMTLTELAYYGLPAILVPYAFAADNHQFYNAKYFSANGASILLEEKNLKDNLSEIIQRLYYYRDELNDLGVAIKKMSTDNAVDSILKHCV